MQRTYGDFVKIIRDTVSKENNISMGALSIENDDNVTYWVMKCENLCFNHAILYPTAYIHCVKPLAEKTGVVLGFSAHKEKKTIDFLAVMCLSYEGNPHYETTINMKRYGCDKDDYPLVSLYNKYMESYNASSLRCHSKINEAEFRLTEEEKERAIADAQNMKDMRLLVELYKDTDLAHLSVLAANMLKKDHTADDFLSFQREYTKENAVSLNKEMWNILQFILRRISEEDKNKYFFRCWGRQFVTNAMEEHNSN